ncbi:anthranilate phosphoribosyltransferase [Caldinitratiruptor microaerophilus]|uniref:Anthranilate phosphoribosyltransferase n=1 Tax=Caldinitratiruptor microaerophilus TaxID=671077 RepID=A0AA35G823_9FIRM|nr:anthranilate phosphoribosyltransferase [Caldinitratiruptor microaerophilus]BDG60636.1 anthranilate phosphoribosyltransferase [Caldinitratiruptor microaerophilus]
MAQELRTLIARVAEGQNLTEEEASQAMEALMAGEATPAQMAALLVALRLKGETVEEITGCARVMRARAIPVPHRQPFVVDTCGTGGDGAGTFNISTTAAFVVAGAGVPVAKHGNRAASSQAGSADVLEALGVRIDLSPEEVGRCIDEVGIGFLFAPALHTAMRHVAPVRREIGLRTIFNFLGPLTNPAGAQAQLVGVFRPDLTEPLARVLGNLGVRRALVVHGLEGIDEVSVSGPTRVSDYQDGAVRTYEIVPEDAGLRRAPPESIRGGTPAENARIAEAVLQGRPGPQRDVVLLNAGMALVAAGRATTPAEGVRLAAEAVDSGRALAVLEGLRRLTCALAAERQPA